jgi:hypothetical protein
VTLVLEHKPRPLRRILRPQDQVRSVFDLVSDQTLHRRVWNLSRHRKRTFVRTLKRDEKEM